MILNKNASKVESCLPMSTASSTTSQSVPLLDPFPVLCHHHHHHHHHVRTLHLVRLFEGLICLLSLFKTREFFRWCCTRERNILERGFVISHTEWDMIGDGCCWIFDVCLEMVLSILAFDMLYFVPIIHDHAHGPLRLRNANLRTRVPANTALLHF